MRNLLIAVGKRYDNLREKVLSKLVKKLQGSKSKNENFLACLEILELFPKNAVKSIECANFVWYRFR